MASSQCQWVLLVPSRANLAPLAGAQEHFPVNVEGLQGCLRRFAKSKHAVCLFFGHIHPTWPGLLPRPYPRCTLLPRPATTGLLGSSLSAGKGRACAALQVHIPLALSD